MKEFNYSIVVSSAILSISIIVGCLIMQGDHKEAIMKDSREVQNEYKPLMTMKETADYLNISEFQVRTIISSEENMLKNTGIYSGKLFPMIRIGNDIFISTNDLNAWLNESTTQRKQY